MWKSLHKAVPSRIPRVFHRLKKKAVPSLALTDREEVSAVGLPTKLTHLQASGLQKDCRLRLD